jgi:hypothetical protein
LRKLSNQQIIDCPRYQYFEKYPFNNVPAIFDKNKPTVGIHINGSAFSIRSQKKVGVILKSLPARLIKDLISDEYII